MGYTRSYTIGVWTGYDNLADGKISGQAENAAQIFYKNMMQYLMKDKANFDWIKPNSVIRQKFYAGNIVTNELYVRGHEPKLPKVKNNGNLTQNNQQGAQNQRNISQLLKYYIVRYGTDGRLHFYYYYRRQ